MSSRTLFAISEPDYTGPWSTGIIVNGSMHSDTRVPLVDCPKCERRGDVRGHAAELPTEFQKAIQRIGDRDATAAESQKLFNEWRSMHQGTSEQEIFSPGKSFPPWRWRVPSVPESNSFYWNVAYVVIGERVRACLDDLGLTEVIYSQVALDAVGTLNLEDPNRFPLTDHIERLLKASKKFASPEKLGKFFFLEPSQNTEVQYDSRLFLEYCKICGVAVYDYERQDQDREQFRQWREKRCIPATEVPDSELFISHIYGGALIVSDRVLNALTKSGIKNFKSVKVNIVAN